MDLNINQRLVQQQRLIMTAQMQQALKILQMPIFDLQVDIAKQLEENPLLEMKPIENVSQELTELRKVIDQGYTFSDNLSYNPEKKVDPLNFIVESETLKEYLIKQLVDIKKPPNIIMICNYIIENIDDRGYLSCTVDDIAKDLGTPSYIIESTLKIVQGFEPHGVAARDLKECLKIQLYKKEIEDHILIDMIDHYLEYIADNKIKKLSCILNISVQKVQEYISMIKTLEPKPSRGFYTGSVDHYVIPEAYIRIVNNELVVLFNDHIIPKLAVNKMYKEILNQETDTKITEFVKNNLVTAENLIKGIEHRNTTIQRILQILIVRQREYFYYGPHFLKPMIIGDLADELELNESTVSRAIKDKYISTPHATVKLRDLFTSGLKSSEGVEGETVSSNFVKTRIKDVIENENKLKPLSDEAISKILQKSGLKIARRTVAKYREEMEILASSKRKKF